MRTLNALGAPSPYLQASRLCEAAIRRDAPAGVAGAQPMRGGPWGVSPQLFLILGAAQNDSDAQRSPSGRHNAPKEGN